MVKKRFSYCLGVLICLFVPRCSFLVPAPVDEGTFITYSVKDEFNTRSVCTLRFKKGPRGLLVVSPNEYVTAAAKQPRGSGFGAFDTLEPAITPDDNGKVLMSRFFKRRGGSRLVLNEFGPPWLPPGLLTPGHRFELGVRFGAAIVDTIAMVSGKKVCVVKIGGRETVISGINYYSMATGILFRSRVVNGSTRYYSPDSTAELVLQSTNIRGM